jgi:1L-myo-inositol 1-phosphate cytidylyltransferase / CDP-L-myo-inositol myo-inositolphosphotransferase
MVGVAVLVMSDGEAISPFTRVGGVSLLKRAVLTAQKAGATTCYLCVEHVTEVFRHEVHDDSRVTSQIVWVSPNPGALSIPEPPSTKQAVIFSVATIVRHPLIQHVSRETVAGKTSVFTDASGAVALALMPGAQVSSLLRELGQGKQLTETSMVLGGGQKRLPQARSLFCHRLTRTSQIAEVEQALLSSLENPRDGQVDTYFNRKLSRPLTRWLLQTSLTPNQITALSCVVGLLGALCFFPGGYWGPLLGASLLQCSVVLDCCDGEVARVKLLESPFGDVLDIVCDTMVTIAIFIGIGVAVWKDGASSQALPLAGMLVLGGCLAFPLVTLAERTEAMGDRRGGWEDGLMKRLVASLTTRDVSVVIFASALTGKLLWFLWGAAIGAQVFWLLLLWLLWRAGRFQHWLQRGEVKE